MCVWIATLLSLIYGFLTTLAGIIQLKKQVIPLCASISMTLLGISLIISAIYLLKSGHLFIVLVISLVFIHLVSIRNGYALHNRPNLRHHIIRFFVALLIILLYLF